MTDTPKSDDQETNTEKSGSTSQEVPPGMLPLVDPVFGKYAFWITAVPFLVYLMGTSMGAYFENNRKIAPAHQVRSHCRTLADVFRENFNSSTEGNDAKDLFEKIDLNGVQTALNDESSEIEKLAQDCNKLLNVEISSLPQSYQPSVSRLQSWIKHWLELHGFEESGDLDEIIPHYTAFIKEMNPDAEVPTLTESWYPTLYTAACLLAFVTVLIALPGYLKHPFRVSPLALGVGVVGIFVWLGLWWLDKETLQIGHWMGGNSRAAFNPFVELGAPTPAWWMYTFIGIRLLGLCIVIPIAEEFFARGFLMRYIEDIDWDQIPLGEATWKGLAGIIAYGAMTHPGEIVAAVAWFGLITWMYLKTKNIWDCVVAHSVTNALLAVYVIATSSWELW